MRKVPKLSLSEIFNKLEADFESGDILYFCDDPDIIEEFNILYEESKGNFQEIKEYLLKHEEKLDKGKMILTLYTNFLGDKESLQNERMKLENSELRSILIQREENLTEQKIQTCKNLLRGIDTYIGIPTKKGVIIYSSEEVVREKRKSDKNILNRIKNIDEHLVEGKNDGFKYITQYLQISDLKNIMPTRDIGEMLGEILIDNTIIESSKRNNVIINNEELYYIRVNNEEKYRELTKQSDLTIFFDDLRNEIIRHSRFLDLDKILLMAGYRIEEYLESEKDVSEGLEAIKGISECIKNKIKDKKMCIRENIENNNEEIEVEYSYKDFENFTNRIMPEKYVSRQEIEDTKDEIIEGKTNINTIDISILNLLELTEEEIDKIMYNSTGNFAFMVELLRYNEKEITEKLIRKDGDIEKELLKYLVETNKISSKSLIILYFLNRVSAEFFKEFSEELNISSEINLQSINKLYHKIKNNKEENEEEQSKLHKQIELYKVLNIEGKSEEEIEEASENTIYELAEDFDKENEDITFYYENGLLTLDTVAEWTGDSFAQKLYNESKITFQDLENLYNHKKISQVLIEKAVLENQELEYAELMAYIYLGYVSENKIEELYMSGKIFDSTLEEIALQGKISPQKYLELSSKRTKEVLEENSRIKLELTNIPTKKEINGIIINESDDTVKDISYRITEKKNKTLIDPWARYKYLELLGAKEATAIIPDEDNAFYNYEFFVIPDANGELQANSVVIAERIWEDKEDQTKGLATENATYFFQYKDLMVNSNLSKKEMTKERDKVISTANHRIGSWAVSVLYRIAQTTKSSNLKEYKKGDERATVVIDELLKLYSHEQLKEILKMAGEIDDNLEHLIEEEVER